MSKLKQFDITVQVLHPNHEGVTMDCSVFAVDADTAVAAATRNDRETKIGLARMFSKHLGEEVNPADIKLKVKKVALNNDRNPKK
jgi:hypothetical protein